MSQQNAMAAASWLESFLSERKENAQKATVLRKALATYDPDNKEQYTAMGLAELEGVIQTQRMGREKTRADLDQAELTDRNQQMQAGQTFRDALSRLRIGGQQAIDASRAPAPVLKALGQFFPGMGEAGAALEEQPDFQPGGQDLLQLGLESGLDPAKVATLADSIARIQALEQRGRSSKDNLRFVKSPTGATVALSGDTGAFQYDPFSKAEAERAGLAPRDALQAFNRNQERIAQIRQTLKLAQDPENAGFWDSEALQAELEDLQGQQVELRQRAGLSGGKRGEKPAGSAKDPDSVIKEANDAIRRGADRDKVRQRLKEKYGLEVE